MLRSIRTTLFHLCLLVVLALIAIPEAKARDLSKLSGLWVLDEAKTQALWQAEKKEQGQDVLDMLNSFYRMDIDFSSFTLVEGTLITIGGETTRTPFTAKEEGETVVLDFKDRDDGQTRRTWRFLPDDAIEQRAADDSPPLVLVRENLLEYSGTWVISNVPEVVEILMKKMDLPADEKPKLREAIISMCMKADFNEKIFRWEPTPGTPSGTFSITNRSKKGCDLNFDRGKAQWLFGDKNNITLILEDVIMKMKRVADK